jgi:hypothetical protein
VVLSYKTESKRAGIFHVLGEEVALEYKLSGKISLKDFIQFNKNYKRHGSALITRLVVYSLLVIFVGAALLSSFDFLKYFIFNLPPPELLKIFSPFIFLAVFLVLLITVGMPLIYKRHYNANKSLQESFNITIDEQCIKIKTETGNSTLTKEKIQKIYYTKDSIYIYVGLNIAHILKKRYLENEGDFKELVKFVKEHYGKNGKKVL